VGKNRGYGKGGKNGENEEGSSFQTRGNSYGIKSKDNVVSEGMGGMGGPAEKAKNIPK